MKKGIYTFMALLSLTAGILGGGSVARAQLADTTTYSMPDPVLTGFTAAIDVTVKGTLDKSIGYAIQVGTTKDAGTTCVGDASIPQSPIVYPTDGKTAEIKYSPTIQMGQTYCVNVTKNETPYLPSVVKTFSNQTFFVPGTSTVTGFPTTTEGCTPNANGCCTTSNESYCMLAPIPGIGEVDANGKATGKINFGSCTVNGVKTEGDGFGCYVNGIIKIVIGLVGVLSVVMLIVSGIEIMTTTSGGEKAAGKERAKNALFGLIIAVGAYTFLNTINPNLTDLSVVIPKSDLTLDDNDSAPTETVSGSTTINGNSVAFTGALCPQTHGTVSVTLTSGGKTTTVNLPLSSGQVWPNDNGIDRTVTLPSFGTVVVKSGTERNQIQAAGIQVNHDAPTVVGSYKDNQPVTALYGLPSSAIQGLINLKKKCNCDVIVTGGTECWEHKTHGPGLPAVDLRKTDSLTAYIMANKSSVNKKDYFVGTTDFYDEDAAHYHVRSW